MDETPTKVYKHRDIEMVMEKTGFNAGIECNVYLLHASLCMQFHPFFCVIDVMKTNIFL